MVSCATERNIEEVIAFNPCCMLSEPKKYWRIQPQLDSNLQVGSSGAVPVRGFSNFMKGGAKFVRRRVLSQERDLRVFSRELPTQIDVSRPIQTCHFNF